MNEVLGFGKSLQYSDGRYRKADLQKYFTRGKT
jgi:hypothetical protein